jgi:SAM-dependent methyltransferase
MVEPEVDLEALSDLQTPWCLHVVVTLRIAEHLVSGVSGIDRLAAAAACDAEALHRVLTYLVRKGIFVEPTPGQFALNGAARGLLDPGLRLALDLEGIGGRMAHAWGTLLGYVKTGRPAYAERFGRPFWEDLEAHPAIGASFDALMGPSGHGTPNPEILVNGDWDAITTVVDVGGGTGALLAQIVRARPAIRGTLVDLPKTVARSAETFQAAGVAERVTAIGQSFFDPLPAGADLYVLAKVLNDWPDAEAAAILRRCAEAARPAGRVVVMGGVSPGEVSRGLEIEMVLAGGKGRTLDDFRVLAQAAGLEVQTAARNPAGRFAVECRPI